MIGPVLATVLPLALLAAVGLVAAWRWVPALRRVPAGWRWLLAAVPLVRRARLWWWLVVSHPARHQDGERVSDREYLEFMRLMSSLSDKGLAARAAEAEAAHWAATEADR